MQRGEDHALIDDFFRGLTEILFRVLLHFLHHKLLIERAAIDADADGFAVVARHFANGGELFVAALAVADVAWIDAVFIERAGAIGIFREQHVAVVMEIADDRRVAACVEQAFLDFGKCGGCFRHVDRHADEFRAGLGQFEALLGGCRDVGGVRVGHRLDDDGRAAADLDFADLYADRFVTRLRH